MLFRVHPAELVSVATASNTPILLNPIVILFTDPNYSMLRPYIRILWVQASMSKMICRRQCEVRLNELMNE